MLCQSRLAKSRIAWSGAVEFGRASPVMLRMLWNVTLRAVALRQSGSGSLGHVGFVLSSSASPVEHGLVPSRRVELRLVMSVQSCSAPSEKRSRVVVCRV